MNWRLTTLLIQAAILLAPCFHAMGQETAVANDSTAVTDSLLSVFDNIELQGVTVTAQRQLVKQEIDRIGYDVQADASSRNSSVLEMLRKVPLVSVDAQDNIHISGSTSFKVYRNGHPDPSLSNNVSEVLKAMPANSVKRIEVITDPGAKYDAEGTTVILNIVMCDGASFKGVSGNVNFKQGLPASERFGLNLTSQLGKVVTNLNYGFSYEDDQKQHGMSHSALHNQVTGNDQTTETESLDKFLIHYCNLSASWEPDTLNLVSMTLGGYTYSFNNDNTSDLALCDAAGNTLYNYATQSALKQNYYNLDGRIDYEHRTHRRGETITLSYMLDTWRQQANNLSQYDDAPANYTGINQDDSQRFAEHTLQLDWARPIAQWHKLETGVKYIYRLNRSHTISEYEGIDLLDDVRFNHTTQVGAAYASYSFNCGPWSARAGLRYEHSLLSGKYPDNDQEDFSRHLNDWVPNASVKYKINDANSITLSYNSSISRPGIELLNPAVTETPTSRDYGNPLLSSAHSHKIALTWMHIGSKLTFNINPCFRFENNGLTQVKWVDGDVSVTTHGNQMQFRRWWLSTFIQWQPFSSTSVTFNGHVAYTHCHSDGLNLSNSRSSVSFNTLVNQQLPWKLRLGMYCGIFGGEITNLYGHSGYAGWYGVGLQRSFLNEDRLSVQLRAHNFLSPYNYIRSYNTQGDIIGHSTSRFNGAEVSIGVSYRFGSLKAHVKSTETTIENDDLVGSGKKN